MKFYLYFDYVLELTYGSISQALQSRGIGPKMKKKNAFQFYEYSTKSHRSVPAPLLLSRAARDFLPGKAACRLPLPTHLRADAKPPLVNSLPPPPSPPCHLAPALRAEDEDSAGTIIAAAQPPVTESCTLLRPLLLLLPLLLLPLFILLLFIIVG